MNELKQKADKFKPRFFIDKDGNWYQDEIQVRHRWTYLFNNTLLKRDEEGRYYVDEGSGRLYVKVEDTPFIVKMIDKRDDGFYLVLNDETEEKLDLNTLRVSKENIAYTKVKNKEFDARFARPAYYELVKYAQQDGDDFYLESEGTKIHLKPEE